MDSDKKSYQNSDGSHGAATPELAKTGPNDLTDAPLLVKQTQAGIWKVEAAANVSRVTRTLHSYSHAGLLGLGAHEQDVPMAWSRPCKVRECCSHSATQH